jgi:hypothetical protein
LDSSADHLSAIICKFPSIEQVDLQKNRFTVNSWNAFFSILKLEHLKYLIILDNTLASIDSRGYFNKTLGSAKLLSKLIWIPKYWIDGSGWKNCVDTEYFEVVLETHKAYYSLIESKQNA